MKELPQSVKACLWSYDVNQMDFTVPSDRFKIIFNVLNYGTSDAITWLMKNFSREEISEVIKKTSQSEWNKKSLSLWSLIFNSSPERQGRFI